MRQVDQVGVHYGPPPQTQVGQLVQAPNRGKGLACDCEIQILHPQMACDHEIKGLHRQPQVLEGLQAAQEPHTLICRWLLLVWRQPSRAVLPLPWLGREGGIQPRQVAQPANDLQQPIRGAVPNKRADGAQAAQLRLPQHELLALWQQQSAHAQAEVPEPCEGPHSQEQVSALLVRQRQLVQDQLQPL